MYVNKISQPKSLTLDRIHHDQARPNRMLDWPPLAWISSDYFESLLLPQLREENDPKQSDDFQARPP